MQRRILIGGFAAAAPLAVLPADAAPRPATAVEVLRTSLSNTDTSGDWLRPGERLRLMSDHARRFDPSSVAVIDNDGRRLGYVPPVQAGALSRLLDAGVAGFAEASQTGEVRVFLEIV